MLRYLRIFVPLVALAIALALRVADPTPLQDLRFSVFDTYQTLSPRPYQPLPVVVVDIDEASLEAHGQWPWPRTLLADLVDRLRAAGAAAIGFDVVFAEPDRTSPDEVAATWPDEGEEIARLKDLARRDRLPNHDRILARALSRARTVGGFVLGPSGNSHGPKRSAGFATAGDDPRQFVPRFPAAVGNIPVLADAYTGAGSLNVVPEFDGVVRRVPLLVARDGTLYPSLAAELLRVAQGASTYIVKSSGASGMMALGQSTGVSQVKIGRFVAPTDAHGRLWLHDTGARPERLLSAKRVLAGEVGGDVLRGAIVLVGTTAAGLRDQHSTPVASNVAGVHVQAQVMEQILSGDFLHRPDWADGAELLLLAALGALIYGLFQTRMRFHWSAALSAVLILGAVGLSWYAYVRWGQLLDPVYPGVVALAVYLSASLLTFLETEREKRLIRSAFSRYMAPALVEQMANNPSMLKLGGESREITVLFCDVRGFTTISERLDAQALTRLLNSFLTPMTGAIMGRQGTIDKYMGDAIMAFWNAPLDVPGHAEQACRAALEMRARLADVNAELAEVPPDGGEEPLPPLAIGVGMNTGECSVGNMGSMQRFDYSALGDSVNLASRLEGQSKTYGVDIVLGEATRAQAGELAFLELDLIRVKGKHRPERIFALLGDEEHAARAVFHELADQHARALEAYRGQDWEGARRAFAKCRELGTDWGLGKLYDLYEARVAAFEAEPPGADWDGVFTATSK